MDEINLFPVTEHEIRTIPGQGLIFIRFAFLSHSMQSLEEADPGRRYVLTPVQCERVISGMQEALRSLQSGGPPRTPVERH